MSFLGVIFVVLMILWLFWGGWTFDRTSPQSLGGTLLPWLCVAIVGYVVFAGPAVVVAR
jgi:hypothetical protein